MRRVLIGMSQERLGSALGLTFQQVQKYEKGTNRIGASRLQQIAGVLNVAAAYFFEDMPAGEGGTAEMGFAEESTGSVVEFLSSAEGLALNKAFVRIKEPRIRRKVVDLVTALADNGVGAPPSPRTGAGGGEDDAPS